MFWSDLSECFLYYEGMITGKPVKQGKICIGKKTPKCFLPLSSFVMHGTKAERGFKDVCSIDWLTSLHSDHFHIEGRAPHRHNGAHFPCSQCGHAAVGCLLWKQAHNQALCQGDTARGEDGEREKCRKEQRQKDVEEGWIQGEQRAERRKVEGRMMCMV